MLRRVLVAHGLADALHRRAGEGVADQLTRPRRPVAVGDERRKPCLSTASHQCLRMGLSPRCTSFHEQTLRDRPDSVARMSDSSFLFRVLRLVKVNINTTGIFTATNRQHVQIGDDDGVRRSQ